MRERQPGQPDNSPIAKCPACNATRTDALAVNTFANALVSFIEKEYKDISLTLSVKGEMVEVRFASPENTRP